MATLAEVDSLKRWLAQVIRQGSSDMQEVLRSLYGESPETIAKVLADVTPGMVDAYSNIIAQGAADYYLKEREEAGIASLFEPPTLPLIPHEESDSLARWAAAPAFHNSSGADLIQSRAIGGLTRLLAGIWADTVIDFGATDTVPVGYQRMARAGCCAFCSMLASRGDVYSSEESATRVVGRGVPIGKSSLARGVRPRGSRLLGESYHDHCRCIGVAVFPGRAQQMETHAAEHLELYREAYAKSRENLSLKSEHIRAPDGSVKLTQYWVNKAGERADPTSETLKELRLLLGAR